MPLALGAPILSRVGLRVIHSSSSDGANPTDTPRDVVHFSQLNAFGVRYVEVDKLAQFGQPYVRVVDIPVQGYIVFFRSKPEGFCDHFEQDPTWWGLDTPHGIRVL